MVQWRRLGAAAAFGSALLAMAACSGDGGRESATPAIPGVDLEGKVLRIGALNDDCLLYTSPSPRDLSTSRMPSSA